MFCRSKKKKWTTMSGKDLILCKGMVASERRELFLPEIRGDTSDLYTHTCSCICIHMNTPTHLFTDEHIHTHGHIHK